MRALLVNPWIYDFAAYDLWSKPLGLLKIAGQLMGSGCDVSLIDCLDRSHPALRKFLNGKTLKSTSFGSGFYYSEEIEKPAIFKDIPRKYKRYGLPKRLFCEIVKSEPKPDVILATSGMTYWYPAYRDAIEILKMFFPDVPVILGGIYANLAFGHAKRFSGADHVYEGCDVGEAIKLIEGVIGEKFDCLPGRKNISLRDAYGLYGELNYVTLRTSNGCPFRCSYCGWYLMDKDMRQDDPDFVLDEIEYFYKERDLRNFAFYDEALLYNAENHVVKILIGLISRKIEANFHTPNGLHCKLIDGELAKLLKRAGFVKPRLGLEMTSAGRQLKTGGKTTNEDFMRAVGYLRDGGYAARDIEAYLLIGLPGQSPEEIEESIRFTASREVIIHLEEYSPIPGTPDYTRSGLPVDADPLFHNNSAFPLYKPSEHREFQRLKDLARKLNQS